MNCTDPNNVWKARGVEKVLLLEPFDLNRDNIGKIELMGYRIGAVINHGKSELIVVQLVGRCGNKQFGLPVLNLEEALERICTRGCNSVH